MKKIFTILLVISSLGLSTAQPTNWENFSATGCDGRVLSIKNIIEDSLKPLVLMWKGYDCGFCREEGAACALSARTYGKTVIYWNAFGRINGNPSCAEAADWKQEYNSPASNFTFLDKPAEDNWSQPSPGQGRWYWVISKDKATQKMKVIYSGNIIKDAENFARRATKDFPTSNESAQEYFTSFKLFPNPATESINLQIDLKSSTKVEVEISDLSGRKIETIVDGVFSTINQNINVTNYAKGMYILNYKVNNIPSSRSFIVN
ncbi:MAG: T9SS C-terminal target domain-containing protein [Cytophagales bacterium]|nr:MAG: T9SS C-terminal target domain-containing protein [Cytophagales bacterium]